MWVQVGGRFFSIKKVCVFISFFFFFMHFSCSKDGEGNVYRIAMETSWNELNLGNKEKNVIAFSRELLQEIARDQGIGVEIVNVSPETGFMDLRGGRYEAMVSALSPDLFIKEEYKLSEPFILCGPLLLLRSDSLMDSLEDMDAKLLGVDFGSSIVYNVEMSPNILIRYYHNISLAIKDLLDHGVDGVIIEGLEAYEFVEVLYKDRIKIIKPPLSDKGLRLVVYGSYSKNLIKYFDNGLKSLKGRGDYHKLLRKWGIPQ